MANTPKFAARINIFAYANAPDLYYKVSSFILYYDSYLIDVKFHEVFCFVNYFKMCHGYLGLMMVIITETSSIKLFRLRTIEKYHN